MVGCSRPIRIWGLTSNLNLYRAWLGAWLKKSSSGAYLQLRGWLLVPTKLSTNPRLTLVGDLGWSPSIFGPLQPSCLSCGDSKYLLQRNSFQKSPFLQPHCTEDDHHRSISDLEYAALDWPRNERRPPDTDDD